MKKFIITEEEKNHIMGLYEQDSKKDMYSTLIGYLVKLDKSGVTNKGIDDMAAVEELRKYYESLRDGKTPYQPLSQSAKIVMDYVTKEIKNLSGEELSSLRDIGVNNQSKM